MSAQHTVLNDDEVAAMLRKAESTKTRQRDEHMNKDRWPLRADVSLIFNAVKARRDTVTLTVHVPGSNAVKQIPFSIRYYSDYVFLRPQAVADFAPCGVFSLEKFEV